MALWLYGGSGRLWWASIGVNSRSALAHASRRTPPAQQILQICQFSQASRPPNPYRHGGLPGAPLLVIIKAVLNTARSILSKRWGSLVMLLWLTILFGWFPASACCARSRPPFPHLRIRGSVNLTPRLSRLTQEALFNANNIPAGTITHAYDAVCNRTSRMVQGLGATVDPIANQNLAFDQRDLILGPNGNPMHDLYDAENRLISRGGGQLTIGYDEDGHRVFETSGGATTVFLVDDRNPTGYSQVLAEYPGGTAGSSANAPTVTYTYGLELIAQNRSGVVRFYGYDGQGSVRLLTDASTTPPIQLIPQARLLTAGYDGLNGSGALPSANAQTTTGPPTAVTDTYDYDAYGQLLAQTGATVNNYRYTGQAWDSALGMYHLRGRYYQPGIDRFWTMDSYEGSTQESVFLHKYIYSSANPINRRDPTGHMDDAISLQAATAIAGGLAVFSAAAVVEARTHIFGNLLLATSSAGSDVITAGAIATQSPFSLAATAIVSSYRTMGDAITKARQRLKDLAKRFQRNLPSKVVPIPASIIPGVAAHVESAQGSNPTWLVLQRASRGQARINRRAAIGGIPAAGMSPNGVPWSLDEYPFASSLQGGRYASVAAVPLHENLIQGGIIAASYFLENIKVGEPYVVVVIP